MKRTRNSSGLHNSKACRCIQHHNWSLFPSRIIDTTKDKGKVVPISVLKVLRAKKLIEGKYICENCATHAKSKYKETPVGADQITINQVENEKEDEDEDEDENESSNLSHHETIIQINSFLKTICSKIRRLPDNLKFDIDTSCIIDCIPSNIVASLSLYLLDEHDEPPVETTVLATLAGAIGKSISVDVYSDAESLKSVYKNPKTLATIDTADYIQYRNRVVTEFVAGVGGLTPTSESPPKQLFGFAVLIESIYHLRHGNVVLPFSFTSNLVQFVTSGSKTVSVINGKIGAGGSYPIIHKWMEDVGVELNAPDGDVEVYFDNIGRYVLKSYQVNASGYKKGRVFTTGLYITLNDSMELQKRVDLLPSNWKFDGDLLQCMQDRILKAKKHFTLFRARLIEKMLKIVALEEKDDVNKVDYHMSTSIEKVNRVCTGCGKEFHNLKYKCDVCSSKVVKGTSTFQHPARDTSLDKVHKIPIDVTEKRNKRKIVMAEPIFLNPNSYDNIIKILDELKVKLKIGPDRDRKWAFVGADGPPYVLMCHLIETDPQKYGWVVPACGLGHLYMNQQKTLASIARNIILEPLAKDILNFESPTAIKYFFKCSDTHKANQAMHILLFGTGLEMVREYALVHENTSVQGFLEWDPSSTFHMLRQLIFNYTLAIFVTKIGDRNNDEEIHQAGRYKFMELFYGFNHPIYQEIEYQDLKQKCTMPNEIRKQREQNLTYTISDRAGKHQGGDFVLEGKVRRQKMLASKGVDTEKMWRIVSRGLDSIIKVTSATNDKLNIHDNDGERNINMAYEILRFRALIRHTEYLTKHNDQRNAYNMYGDPLSTDVLDLGKNCEKRMRAYFKQMVQVGNVNRGDIDLLHILPNDIMDDLLFDVEDDSEVDVQC